MSNSDRIKPPWWLKPANKIFVAMSRLGMRYGPERPVVLTVRGRKSGKLRSTPITPMVIDGKHFVVEGFPGADWVKNAGLVKDGRIRRRAGAQRNPTSVGGARD
jgi:F420H(2)-dependent quinone reductase